MAATRMRPIQHTISLEAARAIIDRAATPLGRTERIALGDANGRIVAGDVTAGADVPPFARAAMDGYAVRAEDTVGASRVEPKILQRIEIVYTGQVATRTVAAGQCIEIATGAPMPPGADAVVMAEYARELGSAGRGAAVGFAVSPNRFSPCGSSLSEVSARSLSGDSHRSTSCSSSLSRVM